MAYRIVIADDNDGVRKLLHRALSDQPGFEIIGEATTGREAVALVEADHPDVILLDLAMPDMDGLEAAAHIRQDNPDTKILVLSGFDPSAMADKSMGMGAHGYLAKGASILEIAAKIREVAQTRLEDQAGDLACSAPGCLRRSGRPCSFVDSEGRRCDTAWCLEHRYSIDDHVYCAVHAAVIWTAAGEPGEHPLPDAGDRLLAMVDWVASDLDADIVSVLTEAAGPSETVVADPVRLAWAGAERIRTWERAWKLASKEGVTLRIGVGVEEDQPDHVLATVNSMVVASVPTPWSDEHQCGIPQPPEVAKAQRADLHRTVIEAVVVGVQAWLDTPQVSYR